MDARQNMSLLAKRRDLEEQVKGHLDHGRTHEALRIKAEIRSLDRRIAEAAKARRW